MAKESSRARRIREWIGALLDESRFRSPGEPSRVYRFLHFWVLVGRSFSRNRCAVRASALAYATLLALIPMLFIVMSVSSALLKGQSEERIGQFIDKFVASVVPPGAIDTNSPPVVTNQGAVTNAPGAPVPDEATAAAPGGSTNVSVVAPADQPVATGETTNAPAPSTAGPDLAASSGKTTVVGRDEASRYIRNFIQSTRSGTLGLTGTAALIMVAILMLSRIEDTLNDIWGVKRGRNWFTRVCVYWTVICLGPVLLLVALGLATGPHLKWTQVLIQRTPHVVVELMFQLLPVALLCLFLSLFYMLVPNTRVRWPAAFIGGLVGGVLWHVNNAFSVYFASRWVSNSKIYGSLAVVPVLMAGIYLSWLILLFGAQVAYAFQNRKLYLQEKLAENVNQRGREFVALRLMTCLAQRFQRGLPPPTIEEMSGDLAIPSRLVQQVLQTLLAARLVMEITGPEAAYAPARPLESINAHHVLMAMRATQGQELVTRDEPVREEVYGEFARIQEAEKEVASSVTLLTLVHRAQTRLEIEPPPPAVEPDAEIKFKPALVPSIDPVASEAPATGPNVEPGGSAVDDANGVEGPTIASGAAMPTSASGGTPESAPRAPSVVQPAAETEREFPL